MKIAGFNALDTWILFPASSLGRVLPKSKVPEDISDKWADCLTRIFGDQSWKKLYSENPQQSFWGDVQFQRDPGVDGIIKLYKPESTEGRPWGQPLKKAEGAPLNLG